LIEPSTAETIEADILGTIRRLRIQAKWWDLSFFSRLSLFRDCPMRTFPVNLIALLPLNQCSALHWQLSRIRRRLF
jgi:hypothetical protein